MFFKLFNKPANKTGIAFVNLVLIACFIISEIGCHTTSTYKYPKENLEYTNSNPENGNLKIISIVLKNGTKVDTKDYEVVYDDSAKSLKLMREDSTIEGKFVNIKRSDKPGIYDTVITYSKVSVGHKTKRTIPINDVLDIYVKKTEFEVGLTILTVLGIITGFVALIFIIILAAKQSCPFVYTFDGNKYVFDGEPLGGAICSGLSRTDYSRLENLKPSGGKFKLLVRNEADEKQFLDEIKLLLIPHDENKSVTPDPEGGFFTYDKIIPPVSVIDESGSDVSAFFTDKDDIKWQTQMPYDTSFKGIVEKHNLKFRFPKPEGAKNALLFINCGTALWGSYMIKAMLQLRGNKVDDWYKNINSGDFEMSKLYSFMEREELYTLKVNLLEDGSYRTRTYIPAGGPFLDEDKIIKLPLDNVTDNYVEFTLNPPAGYWKIDRLGLIYDYEKIDNENIRELDAVYANDGEGNDFKDAIRSRDKNYYNMLLVGNTANIYYDVPPEFEMTKNEIYLKTSGYYEVNTDKKINEQKELIEAIMSTPGKIIKYSMMLYNQKVKGITEHNTFDDKKIK